MLLEAAKWTKSSLVARASFSLIPSSSCVTHMCWSPLLSLTGVSDGNRFSIAAERAEALRNRDPPNTTLIAPLPEPRPVVHESGAGERNQAQVPLGGV